MTIDQIAKRLVELCREMKYEQAQKELYADDAVSIELMASPAFPEVTKGLDGIIEKGRIFESMVKEMHENTVTDALVTDNWFSVGMLMDMTSKEGKRTKMNELCIYKVKDGKIVEERFFY